MTATAIGSYATQSALAALIGGGQTFSGADVTEQGLICDWTNQYMESEMHQVCAPISSATYLYDGRALRHLYLPFPVGTTVGIGGIRAATLVEVAPYSGGTYETLAASDYFLRGAHGPGGPFRQLVFSDLPTGSYTFWPDGYATVRVTGTAGWAAIPDDLTRLALTVAQRWWNARQSGFQSVDSVDENGRPMAAKFFALPEYRTLKRYTVPQQPVIAGQGRPPLLRPLSRSNW